MDENATMDEEEKPGRIRVALAKLLSATLDADVHPADLVAATGGHRTGRYAHRHWYRWEGEFRTDDGFLKHLTGWSTMTDCVRIGRLLAVPRDDNTSLIDIGTPEKMKEIGYTK